MRFNKNIGLDAALVEAAAEGGFDKFMFAARNLGLKPSEAVRRAEWLKKRDANYIQQVSNRVVQLLG